MLSKTTGLRNFLIISSQSIVISLRNAAENDVQILKICDSSSFKCILRAFHCVYPGETKFRVKWAGGWV
jgi:hypothetical protein